MPWGAVVRTVHAGVVIHDPEGASPFGVPVYPSSAAFPSWWGAEPVGGFSHALLPILGCMPGAGTSDVAEDDPDMLAMEAGFTDCEWAPSMLTTRTVTSFCQERDAVSLA
jgi:hypothetical protein